MGTKGLRSTMQSLARSKRQLNRRVDERTRRAAHIGERRQKEEIIENDAVATTELFREAEGTVRTHDAVRVIRIANDADHAGFVEFGTGQAGKVPMYSGANEYLADPQYKAPELSPGLIAALTEWAEIKPGVGARDNVGFDSPISVGYRAALTISGNVDGEPSGTTAQPFFRPAVEDAIDYLKVGLYNDVRRSF